jgi:hypothetical protein
LIPKPHGWLGAPVKKDQRLTVPQVLEKIRALKLSTPAESAAFVREDRDTR